jgi:hypothetical protein
MSILKVHNRKLHLSKTQQGMLERSLRDLVSGSSKQRTTELDERFRRRRRFGKLLEAEVKSVGFDVEKLKRGFGRFANQENARLHKAFMARVKERRERGGRRRSGRPAVVLGLNSGYANPPYDFTWTTHNVIGPDPVGSFSHTADPNTGLLGVHGAAHDSRPRQVDSFAGLGFMFIPDRVGVLSVSIAPPVYEFGHTYAVWYDVSGSDGWISLGIVSYPRTGPGFPELAVVDRDLLWSIVSYWFDNTSHRRFHRAYSMSVSTLVDPFHSYACQAWIEASAYAQNGESRAFSNVEATVGAFTYTFVPIGTN